MADQDEWRLGDEDAGGVCSVCGHRGRADLTRCPACGAPLADDEGPSPLRTLGEAMGGARPARRHSRRVRPRLWRMALLSLAAVVVAGYWISRPPKRHLVLDDAALAPGGGAPTSPALPAAPTPAVHARAQVPPAEAPPPRVAPPPPPQPPVRVAPPPPAPPRAAPPPPPIARPAPVPPPPPRAGFVPDAADDVERDDSNVALPRDDGRVPPESPPLPGMQTREEKPSLGSDLVEAQRAYSAAVNAYNARADAYNALADEYQSRERRGDDFADLAELRRRLERAREQADRARAEADTLRLRYEDVQARYR